MSKRNHDDADSVCYIKKKIKKWERKLLKGQRRRLLSSSPESVQLSVEPQDDTNIESEYYENIIDELVEPRPSTSASCLDQQPVSHAPQAAEIPLPSASEQIPAAEKEDQQTLELDEMFLELLGADPTTTVAYGKDIQKDLAIRFEFIASSGLSKDLRKELLESHLPPSNCKMIDAPALNPEIKAAVTEIIVKRDKAMQAKQKQICSAIACLSEAITLMLSKDIKDPVTLKLLIDTGRILCDSQHNESITRRNFIMAVLKKDLKDQMQLTKIDSLLFGQDLADTLKTAKAISKSGAELKSVPPPKSAANKIKPTPSNKTLNWKAPAPSRRLTGPPRAKESAPMTRQQHAPSSRPSRPSTSRGRR